MLISLVLSLIVPASVVFAQITTSAAIPRSTTASTIADATPTTSATTNAPSITTSALPTSAVISSAAASSTFAITSSFATFTTAPTSSQATSSAAVPTAQPTSSSSSDSGSLNSSTKQILIIIGSCVGGVILLLLLFCIIQRCRHEKFDEETVVTQASTKSSSAHATRPLDAMTAPAVESVPYVPYYGYGYQQNQTPAATYTNPAYAQSPQIVYSDSNGGYYQDVEGPVEDEYYASNVGVEHHPHQYYGNRAAVPPAHQTSSSLPEHL